MSEWRGGLITVTSGPDSGARLREARGARSMYEVGAAVNVSAAYISRIENDERIPSLQLLYRFADHLGVNRDWLATGQTSKLHPSRAVEI
jgi:transcriptional regulator with XRE-family HTH domain